MTAKAWLTVRRPMVTINPIIKAVNRSKMGRVNTPRIAKASGSAAFGIENKVAPSTDWLQQPFSRQGAFLFENVQNMQKSRGRDILGHRLSPSAFEPNPLPSPLP